MNFQLPVALLLFFLLMFNCMSDKLNKVNHPLNIADETTLRRIQNGDDDRWNPEELGDNGSDTPFSHDRNESYGSTKQKRRGGGMSGRDIRLDSEYLNIDPELLVIGPEDIDDHLEKTKVSNRTVRLSENDLAGGNVDGKANDEYRQMYDTKVTHGKDFLERKLDGSSIKLKLNRNALERKTDGPDDPNRIAMEKIWSCLSETPQKIGALVFESDGHSFTNLVMITRDGSESTVSLSTVRSSVEGVSKSVNPTTSEVSGICLTALDGSKTNIYPQLAMKPEGMDEIKKAMRNIKVGDKKLPSDIAIFVRNQRSVPAKNWPRKERVDVTSQFANYP